jgi:hypothetical protein
MIEEKAVEPWGIGRRELPENSIAHCTLKQQAELTMQWIGLARGKVLVVAYGPERSIKAITVTRQYHRRLASKAQSCQRDTKRSPPKLITGASQGQSTAGSYSTHGASCTFREPEESRNMTKAVRMNMDSEGGFILVYCIA